MFPQPRGSVVHIISQLKDRELEPPRSDFPAFGATLRSVERLAVSDSEDTTKRSLQQQIHVQERVAHSSGSRNRTRPFANIITGDSVLFSPVSIIFVRKSYIFIAISRFAS